MKTSILLRSIMVLCAALVVSAPASAGPLYWNMQTLTSTTNGLPTSLTVGALTQANSGTTGLSSVLPSTGYTFTLNGASQTASGSNNLAFSVASGILSTASSSYVAVNFSLLPGRTGTISAIGFGSRVEATGPTTLTLRSSLDNYAANVATFVSGSSGVWTYFTNTFTTPVSLSGTNTNVTLRLYGSGGTGGVDNWRVDDLQFTVAVVPEPSAIALAVFGAAGIAVATRRLRKAAPAESARSEESSQG
ncbi:PEP-CTERM sorting domain-containing protein [bacterium]|nr:PEP-CTERM sorting domain-containing protein [bacterium]